MSASNTLATALAGWCSMSDRFDIDQFEERAAICEFCAGMSRFDAETIAAQAQGVARWQALKIVKEATDANGRGSAGGYGHQAHALDGQRDALPMSRVQPEAQEKNGPMSERQPEAGRDRGALLALQLVGGEAV